MSGGLEKQEMKAILLELTQEIKKLREAIKPPEIPGVPAFLRVQEYYRIVAKKRIDVLTTGKGEPYVIKTPEDPKILLLIPWGDDVQVDFDAEVTEDSPPIKDGTGLSLATEDISKIYAKSLTTDLKTPPNGLYILLLG